MEHSGVDGHEDVDGRKDEAIRGTSFPVGSEGIWTFVFMDMVVFGLIFLVFSVQRVQQFQLYETSQTQLNPVYGFVNTIVLLTSSWAVVRAVGFAREGSAAHLSRSLTSALLLGCVFLGTKIVEYHGKFSSGVSVTTNSFFTFYFFITFLHLLHVLAGMGFMLAFRRNPRPSDSSYVTKLESLGTFWHFVDLLWVFIYALLYLL